jgi:hypothetical protein
MHGPMNVKFLNSINQVVFVIEMLNVFSEI